MTNDQSIRLQTGLRIVSAERLLLSLGVHKYENSKANASTLCVGRPFAILAHRDPESQMVRSADAHVRVLPPVPSAWQCAILRAQPRSADRNVCATMRAESRPLSRLRRLQVRR